MAGENTLLSVLTKLQVTAVIFLVQKQSLFTYLVKWSVEICNTRTQRYSKHLNK